MIDTSAVKAGRHTTAALHSEIKPTERLSSAASRAHWGISAKLTEICPQAETMNPFVSPPLQCVHPPPNRRTGVTAAAPLAAGASPMGRLSSTSVTRATL